MNWREGLIARLWHEKTSVVDADEYAEFMKSRAAPNYGSVDGLEHLSFLRRDEGEYAHFLPITV